MNKIATFLSLVVLGLSAVNSEKCERFKTDFQIGDREYMLSWSILPGAKWDWKGASHFCRTVCADPISIENEAQVILDSSLPGIFHRTSSSCIDN